LARAGGFKDVEKDILGTGKMWKMMTFFHLFTSVWDVFDVIFSWFQQQSQNVLSHTEQKHQANEC
jgi:hypothetical protein